MENRIWKNGNKYGNIEYGNKGVLNNMTRPEIPSATVEAMQEDARTGMSRSDIAKKYGVDLKTVDKYCKPILSEMKKKPLQDPFLQAQKEAQKAITSKIVGKVMEATTRSLEVGEKIISEWEDRAEMRNMDLVNYIDYCVSFTSAYEGVIDDMQRELKAQDRLIKVLKEYADPAIERRERIHRYVLYSYICGHQPKEEILRKLFVD